MRFTVAGDDGVLVDFECANTTLSRWTCEAILAGETYPYLPFVEDVQVVFDVGANCGAATVHFARHHPDATIHSFEPASEPMEFLERNVAGYPNVHVHRIGLHSVDQVVPLYHGNPDTGLGSVFRRAGNSDESEPVQFRAGDLWAAQHGIQRIDLLKIDVEGCEVEVLSSLAHLLPTVKVLYLEYDSRQARRDVARLVDDTHELYTGVLFLEHGECVYINKELTDLDAAAEHLRALLRLRLRPGRSTQSKSRST